MPPQTLAQRFPLFLSTVPSLQPEREDPETRTLQRCIARHLAQYWQGSDWDQEVRNHWLDLDLVPLSCDGPPTGAMSTQVLQELYEDVQTWLRARGDTLQERLLILVMPDGDAIGAYAAFAVYLAQRVPQTQPILVMSVMSIQRGDWDICTQIPGIFEIDSEGNYREEKKTGAQ